jgi:integrase
VLRVGTALDCGGVPMTLPPGIKLRGGKLSCQIQLPSGRTWRTLPTADPVQAAALKNLAQQKALQGIDYLGGVVDDSSVDDTQFLRPVHRPAGAPGGLEMFTGSTGCTIELRQVFNQYLAAGAPDSYDMPAPEQKFKLIERRIRNLRPIFDPIRFNQLQVVHCKHHKRHRVAQITAGPRGAKGGTRTVETELTQLSVVLTWACQEGLIPFNPLHKTKPKFRRESEVQHCTEFMPRDAETFHNLARKAFQSTRSEVFGWQILLEGITGCRTHEITKLPRHAENGQPGYFDEKRLYIKRGKGGRFNFIQMTPYLHQVLVLCRQWGDMMFPHSKHLLPGRDGISVVSNTGLAHWLKRQHEKYGEKKYTSHGMRAFFVRVMRSQGIAGLEENGQSIDEEIAKRLGHAPGTGATLVQKTYGENESGWCGGKELDFIPKKDAPAWVVMEKRITKNRKENKL